MSITKSISVDLVLVNVHVQFLGLTFLIYTFVIMFYAQALQRDRRIDSFLDWFRNWALVWIGLSIPVIFVTSLYSLSFLWGFECVWRGIDNKTCLILFNVFKQQTEPFVWIVYLTSGVMYLIEAIMLHHRLSTFKLFMKVAEISLICGFWIMIGGLIIVFINSLTNLLHILTLLAYIVWIIPPYFALNFERFKKLFKKD